MKKIYVISGFLFLFVNAAYGVENTCETQWIQQNGERYKPPKSLETLHISFINELDSIKFRTKNKTSYYEYKSFIDIDGRLGISYTADNGNILDLFQDGILRLWRGNTPILKAKCLGMKLDIKKVD